MEQRVSRWSRQRMVVAVCAALLLGATMAGGAMYWFDPDRGYEEWNACPSDGPLLGPNGERYRRDRMKECKWVDDDGDVVDTNADGTPLCKEQELDIPC